MRRHAISFSCCLALATAAAHAQATDVGLTMDGGLLTVLYGQICGPVACTPFVGGAVGAGQSRSLVHYGAPQSLYAIAIGLPMPCVAIPGIDNVALLNNPVFLDAGVTSAPPFVPTPCQQGVPSAGLTIPANAPLGFVFRVQSFGVSNSGQFALGPAIEATIL